MLCLKLGIIDKQIKSGWMGLGLLPPFVATILFFSLWHDSWFKNKEKSLRHILIEWALIIILVAIVWCVMKIKGG